MKKKGTIKWYNAVKQYGFILSEEQREKDIFFHKSEVVNPQANIEIGKSVMFREGQGKKGFEAKEVEIL